MSKHYQRGLFLGLVFLLSGVWFLYADDPTSKFVPLSPLASTLAPSSSGLAVQLEVWDQASGGTMIYSEAHTVDTDDGSNITNDTNFADLLLGRPSGLDAANFPYGSSRYLDVTQGGVSVLAARLPLYASVFSLTDSGIIAGNLALVNSTPTAGNILKGGIRFLHNFGTNNTFLGLNAGNLMMPGQSNTAIGYQALSNNTTGSDNTANGTSALSSNTTGNGNTATGAGALVSNTVGVTNTATGSGALFSNTTGFGNTATGASALVGNTIGVSNTATGSGALLSNTTGGNNTATGTFALLNNTTGRNNTAIGYGADVSMGDLINATAIGANARVAQSNSVVLGDNVSVGIGTPAPKAKLHVQDGNVLVGSPGAGIILKSPDGTLCRLLTIDNAGVMVLAPIACP